MLQNQGLAVSLDKDTGLLKSIGVVRPDGITMIKVRGGSPCNLLIILYYKTARPRYLLSTIS